MKGILSFSVVLLCGYGALLLYVFLVQSRLLYLPEFGGGDLVATPGSIGLDFENVTLRASDGIALHAWFVPAESASGTVLFMHGNAGNISHRLESIERFNRLGLHVLIFDYRGYGKSAGRPTEQGTYRDARAAWQYLVKQRGIAPGSIVIFGRSLGGAVATQLASETSPAGLIVESSFTSVPDVAAEIYWFLPVRLLSRFRYGAREMIQAVTCPVMVIHSTDDEIIPFTHAQRLFEAAPGPKRLVELSGGHNDGVNVNQSRYERELAGFLDMILVGQH